MVMGEETFETQLAVIGGGPGGYAAAFRAADLGLDVVLINDEAELGGVCLRRGCIPSKALLENSRLLREARHAAERGLRFEEPAIDLDQMRTWKDEVVGRLTGGLGQLADARDVKVIQARATFEDDHTVRLEGADIALVHFEEVIIATGSRPVPLPDTSFDKETGIWDSKIALDLPSVPERLLVVGGGYIGLELGSVYAALGSAVTVVEMTDSLLPGTDPDLVQPVAEKVARRFAALHFNTRVEALAAGDDGIEASFSGEHEAEDTFDAAIVAVGRQPTTGDLGLDRLGVKVDDDGFIVVDDAQRTALSHIYAIGDVTGEPLLAHKAMYEGKVAAELIAGEPAAADARCIPAVVYTDPEIAWCGLTAAQAGEGVETGRFPWRASGRALTMDRETGLTKILFDRETERVLGVSIVGPDAGELIAEGALAVEMGALARDLAQTIHPHPTLSETTSEAAEAFLGIPTHILE